MTELPFLPILTLLLILSGGLFIVVIRTERAGPSPLRILTRSIVLLLLIFLGLCLTVDDFPYGGSTGSSVETYIFPAGQSLRNESNIQPAANIQPSGNQPRFNRLTYRPHLTAPPEPFQMDKVLGNPPTLTLHALAPQLITTGDRAVLVLGPHVFRRTPPSPYATATWSQISTVAVDRSGHAVTDPQLCLYLRSFLPPGDPRLARPPSRDNHGGLVAPDLKVPYHFHHFDLERMHYTLRRATPGTSFPEYLVYSIPPLQKHLTLDLPLTRALNHLPPPADADLQIEFDFTPGPTLTNRPTLPRPVKAAPYQPYRSFTRLPPSLATIHGMAAGRSIAAASGMAAAYSIAAESGIAAAYSMAAGFSIAVWYSSPQPLRAAVPTLSICGYRDYPYDPVEPLRRIEVQFMFFDAQPGHACIAWRQQWLPPFEIQPYQWHWDYVQLDSFHFVSPRTPTLPFHPYTFISLRLSRAGAQ